MAKRSDSSTRSATAAAASANRLGTLALVLADRTADAVAEASGHSDSTAAALSALHHFLDAPSIELLRQVLGLTHSGTVRLVDRLERDGLVRRRPGPDARSTAVSLTAAGRRVAAQVTTARAEVLVDALATLPDEDRAQLDRIVGDLLVSMKRGYGATRWICRMCDTGACGLERGECPLGEGKEFNVADSVRELESRIAVDQPTGRKR